MAMSSNPDPELIESLLEAEEEAANVDRFEIGINTIIQHLQTSSSLKQSCKHIRKLVETSLLHSYNRIGKIQEADNDHVVFDHSYDALQKEIESSIQVAENINTIFKSILPRHTLDYVSGKEKFFLVNFSKSENLKVSKFRKETDFVLNKVVDLAAMLYDLRTITINNSIVESIQYGHLRIDGTQYSDYIILDILSSKNYRKMLSKVITQRDELMMKIQKAIKDLEGILFGIYVMVQTQVAISEYAISDKWSGTGTRDIEKLADERRRKRETKTRWWCGLNRR